jgi:hypothetical protein
MYSRVPRDSDPRKTALPRASNILYNVGCSWSVLTTNCTVNPRRTPFGLVIPLLQSSITRNYNHTQFSITRLRVYTIIITYTLVTEVSYYTLTRLHWLTSQLSLLSRIITHSTSSHFPCLSPIETSLVELLINNWLVGLLLKNWLLRHSSSSYITLNRTSVTVAWKGCLWSVSEQQRARWGLCYVTRGNTKVTWYSPTPVPCDVIAACCVGTRIVRFGSARHGTEKTPLPLLLRNVYSVARCLPVGYLETLCCVTQQWVDMWHYFSALIFVCVCVCASFLDQRNSRILCFILDSHSELSTEKSYR